MQNSVDVGQALLAQ